MSPPVLKSLLRTTPSLAPIVNRAILSVTGPNSSEFLNGLLSTAVRDPPRNQFSSFLNAQGRVICDVFLYGIADGYLLEYDSRSSEAPSLLSYLKRHVLRSKVKIRNVTDEFSVWAAWGSSHDCAWETERKWNRARSGAIEPAWTESTEWPWGTQDYIIRDRRAVGLGRRLLAKRGESPQDKATHDVVSHETYLLHRISNGVPEGAIDIAPMQAFPMDSNLDVMGGLDFRKGCYVGQELTVRTYHTGVVRKRIFPVALQYAQEPEKFPSSQPVHIEIKTVSTNTERPGARSRVSGKLLSNQTGIGLALLRLEHVTSFFAGDLKFELDVPDGTTMSATPRWPDWWPHEARGWQDPLPE